MRTFAGMEGFRHSCEVQVRFKDVDALGHVNNANHLSYAEFARITYFNEVVGKNINWDKNGIILASAKVDYKKPIRFGDALIVFTRCFRLGNKSFDLEYTICRKEGSAFIELARVITTMVCYDYVNARSVQMDEAWRNKIRSFEQL